MELLEPILFVTYSEQLVGQMKPSECIKLMIINGWSIDKLKYQYNFDKALYELQKQSKWN